MESAVRFLEMSQLNETMKATRRSPVTFKDYDQ